MKYSFLKTKNDGKNSKSFSRQKTLYAQGRTPPCFVWRTDSQFAISSHWEVRHSIPSTGLFRPFESWKGLHYWHSAEIFHSSGFWRTLVQRRICPSWIERLPCLAIRLACSRCSWHQCGAMCMKRAIWSWCIGLQSKAPKNHCKSKDVKFDD